MRSILALDVSKRGTGFAFGRPDQKPVTGIVVFPGLSSEEVWRNASIWINGQLKVFDPDELGIEMKIQSSGHSGFQTDAETQDLLGGLQAIIRTFWFNRSGRPADRIPSQTARKTLCGRGQFEKGTAKDHVQAEVVRRGWMSLEDMQPDKADALAVWCHMAAQQIPELAFNPPKRKPAPATTMEF